MFIPFFISNINSTFTLKYSNSRSSYYFSSFSFSSSDGFFLLALWVVAFFSSFFETSWLWGQACLRGSTLHFWSWLVWDVWSFSPIPVLLSWNQCQSHRDGNVACLVVLLVTTLVRGLVGTSGLPGVYNRKYMSWARRKDIFGFILHILTCFTCPVVVIRRLSCQKSCISGL